MSQPEEYDVVVLGSGAAGKLLAWTLASQGKRTAVVERRYVGGSCPNIACLPSKNVIHGAKVADYFRRGAEFGIAGGDWKVDMAAVRDRKRKMVDGLVEMHLEKYRESGAELVMGQGRFVAPKTIEVALNAGGTRTLRGQTVIIDTGSRARIDDTPGLAEAAPADPRRGPGSGRAPGTPDRPGRRLRRPRAGPGVPPLRQPRDRRRAERRADPPRGPGRHRGGRAALPGRGDRGPDRDRRRSRRGAIRRVRPPAHGPRRRSRGRTSSSPGAARRTPTASAWRRRGSRRTREGTSRSTSGCGRRPRASGRWATAPAARTSRTSARTTSAWCWPTSPAGTA